MELKEAVTTLMEKGVVCKRLEELAPAEIKSRKKISIYYGITEKGYYCALFVLYKKSRLLGKDARELFELHSALEKYKGNRINRLFLLPGSDICSKTKALLSENGWIVFSKQAF